MFERVIAEVSKMSTEALSRIRQNATTALKSQTADANASRLKVAIDSELTRRFPGPSDGWSNGTQGDPRFLREAGIVRAMIIRLETHGASKGGYLIEILGEVQQECPRHIEEARTIVERRLKNLGPEIRADVEDK